MSWPRKWLSAVFKAMKKKRVGVLAFQGDVSEHIEATVQAAKILHQEIEVIPVRTKESLLGLDALIIPGGESTTLYKLCQAAGMWEELKRISHIFGTCAGAIMLAKTVLNKTADQKTLELMDITIDRNAYGRQADSFVKEVKTEVGKIEAVFIRAPRIRDFGKAVRSLAENDKEVIACEERKRHKFYLAACFHPELTTNKFHEYFLRNLSRLMNDA